MMPPKHTGLMLFLALLLNTACTPILSVHTDEQAWVEYQKSKREPATQSNPMDRFAKISVRKILLACNKSSQLEACYRAGVVVAFDSHFKNDPDYKKILKEFQTLFSFERVYADVQSFHQVLLSGMELRAVDHVRELHKKCGDRDNAGVNLHAFGPFLGGDTDLPRGFYACLNEDWEKDEKQLLYETTERLGLSLMTSDAESWIRDRQIDPVYQKVTHDWLRKQMTSEKQKWDASLSQIRSRFDDAESLEMAVKRLSPELRKEYRFLPVEVQLTELYRQSQRH